MAEKTKEEAALGQTDASGLEALRHKLETELKKLPPEQVQKAKAEIEDLLSGGMRWAELLTWPPEKLHELAKRGYDLYQTSLYQKAEIIFKGLTVLDPENFYYHQMLAACYQQQEKATEAIFEYSVALEIKPDDIVSRTNRGEVYLTMKIFELAGQDFAEAIRLDPEEKDRWGKRSRILKKKVDGILSTQRNSTSHGRRATSDKKKAATGTKGQADN